MTTSDAPTLFAPDAWTTFERNARRFGERPAIHFEDHTHTYADLYRRAAALATALARRCGVEAGDRVGILAQNRPEFLELYFACARLGAIIVPLGQRLAPNEIDRILGRARPKACFADRQLVDGPAARSDRLVGFPDVTRLADLRVEGALWYEELASGPADDPTAERRPWPPDTPLVLVFTSGTTGAPKGVLLSQGNLVAQAASMLMHFGLHDDDVLVQGSPMSHTTGLVQGTQEFLIRGLPIVLLRKWTAASVAEACRTHSASVMTGALVLVERLLEAADADPETAAVLRRLRVIGTGGGLHTADFDHRVMTTLDPEIYLFGYGLTETTAFAVCTGTTAATLAREGGLGYPIWCVESRLVGEDEAAVPVGAEGELWLRGGTVTPGYFGQPARGPAEWLPTGDIMRADEAGCLYFVSRKKDVIKTGGFNVYGSEVEAIVRERLGSTVRDVVVVGGPSRRWGEAVVAYVVCDEELSLAQVQDAVHDDLGGYKMPKKIVRIDAIPTDYLGKVDKKELRARLSGMDIS